jgi:uncharacterized membrane protein
MQFKATTKLDKAFEIGIILKGLDGVLETIGGLILLFIRPEFISSVAVYLTQHELSEDPHDFIATHILHSSQTIGRGALIFAAVYLLTHGITKIILVAEILRNRLWAYLGLIYLTVGFIIYQSYRFIVSPTWGLALFTIYDVIVVWLTVLEYRKRQQSPPIPPTDRETSGRQRVPDKTTH